MRRLRGRSETRRVIAEGLRARVPGARLYFLPGSEPLRITVITPVQVGNAVCRSALRRRLREALRDAERRGRLRGAIVLVAGDSRRIRSLPEMAEAIAMACDRRSADGKHHEKRE